MVKKITPIIQARMGSSRLPGKTLRSICGESVLSHIIRRVGNARLLEPMIIATSTHPADDAVEAECARLNITCFRGSENDVLSRYYEAARLRRTGHVMRLCADNPLTDPGLLDELAAFYDENDYSYVSHKGIALGLGAEIFTLERLEDAFINGKQPYHREHVTPYIYEGGVGCGSLNVEQEYGHLRLTMDTEQDFAFITAVYESLYHINPAFGLAEVMELLTEKPELLKLNSMVRQRGIH